MANIESLYQTDEPQLMLLTDNKTGTVLQNDNGDEMGIYLTNRDTEACKKVIAKFQSRHKKRDASYAELQRFNIDLMEAATTGFHNLQLKEGGSVVDYSEDQAREMYQKSAVIRKQVDEYFGEDDNFLQGVLSA